MSQWKADAVLALLTVITGSTYFISKLILQTVEPFNFLTLRFSLSSLLLYILLHRRIHAFDRKALWPCVRVGIFLAVGIVLMTLGLTQTQSGQAAFIISMEVVLVPLLLFILYRERIDGFITVALPLAVLGLGLLTLQQGVKINAGDLWVLASACCFALYTIYNSRYAVRYDPLVLAWVQVTIVAFVSLIGLLLLGKFTVALGVELWAYISFLIVIATVIRFVVQTYAQKYTNATHTSLIFMLEPVVAALFGWSMLGELLSPQALWGCLLIMLATLVAKAKYLRIRLP